MDDSRDYEISRRDLIKLGAAAGLAASLGVNDALGAQLPSTSPQGAGSFFTPGELALVDELSELIIPTDEHSPGARAANVAAYIDRRLAEAWDEQDRMTWREGLARIDKLSAGSEGQPFLQAAPAARIAVLTRISSNEGKPTSPDELFFAELKSRVVQAYYTSEIGIKQEMEYKGNSYLAEFVGFDAG